jgi:hypothetical protein
MTQLRSPLLDRLDQLRKLCPDMRLGQLMATLGELSEDELGRGLWDVEDDQLASTIERFVSDLQCRRENKSIA